MKVKDVIDLIELRLNRSGIKDTPASLIRDVMRLKLHEFCGADDMTFTLKSDGSKEYELPKGLRRVEFVIINGFEALQCNPEEGDRAYAENSTASA